MNGLFRPEVVEHRAQRLHGEVVLSQPMSTSAIVVVLAAVMVAVSVWLALGSFARTETARGTLVTIKPSTKVVATAPGVVTSLIVFEGARVKRGERLASLILERRAEDGHGFASGRLETLSARMAIAKSQMRLETARLTAERNRLTTAIESAKTEARQLDDQIALQLEMVASNKNMIVQIGPVVERGFVSRNDLERRRQTFLSSQQVLASLKQQRIVATSRAEQSRAELDVLANQSATQVDTLRSSSLELKQQEIQLRGEQSYSLLAPIDGIVTALQTAQGRSTSSGATLMTIIPEGTRLRAEVYAPSRAIGLVQPGQEARLLYDAFPYQRFGSFGGHIATVSRIAIDPQENETAIEAKEPVYRVVVDLDRQSVAAYGANAPLQAGMTLTANIVLERQSFIAWLLTPLRAIMNRTR